jgi:adenine-specific DNA-methyltransferase
MPRGKKNKSVSKDTTTVDYRYPHEKRTNIPPGRIAGEGTVPKVAKVPYSYSPHLPPSLQFDQTGQPDALTELVDKATRTPLSAAEATKLRDALQRYKPWLEWTGKRENHSFEIDPVALHMHERVSTQAILRVAAREDVQRDLFADPQQEYAKAVQFYKHEVDWTNRLILGDSLQVMSSLAQREGLAGKVQMIYMDPPYGIKFGSNFQPEVGRREVGDRDRDLTREPETVKAYRDTWTLGVHSYLAYLRDRLIVAHDLLSKSGHIFIQIGEDNVHLVRGVLEEIFGVDNHVLTILLKKKAGQKSGSISPINDYILWSTKDKPTGLRKFSPLFSLAKHDTDYLSLFALAELPTGEVLTLSALSSLQGTNYRERPEQLFNDFPGIRLVTSGDATIGGVRKNQSLLFRFQGRQFDPGLQRGNCWKHTANESDERSGMRRLAEANRLIVGEAQLRVKRYADDFGAFEVSNWWDEFGGAPDRIYAVQTNPRVIERCMLMCTAPGDLVLDPTCGSGTTAYVAEHWGRRWVTIDTSRVSIALARQRLLTASFDYYRVKEDVKAYTSEGRDKPGTDPSHGFLYKVLPHVTSSVVANCAHLDPLIDKHAAILDGFLYELNRELKSVTPALRQQLSAKLDEKVKQSGKKSVTEADRRRWLLPQSEWQHWEVPFDTDSDWPKPLQETFSTYRSAWRAKMDEVNACIAVNADVEELVNKPEIVKGVLRVSGPFTVEGVRPEELNLGDYSLFDGSPNENEAEPGSNLASIHQQNLQAYLDQMVQLIRHDGLTFLNNKRRRFAQVDSLFDAATGAVLHAEGSWEDSSSPDVLEVAIGFGPQYGPVTAFQVEELIHASKRHNELVVAGFSFDADATALIQEQSHPKLRIHQAYIRPDVNPGMEGLLKETPDSQLFTVFGTPEIEIKLDQEENWVVHLKGVEVYDPVANTISSTGADKVAAWFLDSDFDGRCFCITQAFFPNQDSWEKIAKALGSDANADAFDAFKGTTSIPFSTGKYKRVAVKVIDPRGNEVMTVRALEALT